MHHASRELGIFRSTHCSVMQKWSSRRSNLAELAEVVTPINLGMTGCQLHCRNKTSSPMSSHRLVAMCSRGDEAFWAGSNLKTASVPVLDTTARISPESLEG